MGNNIRFGRYQRPRGKRDAKDYQEQQGSSGINGGMWRGAILAACDRFEANEEIKRQHGPVKILWKDGKPLDQ